MLHTPNDIMIHPPPMVFIDSLLSCSETEAVAQITFAPDHYGVHHQFVSETALVECMAQTAAAQQGQLAKEKGVSPQFGITL